MSFIVSVLLIAFVVVLYILKKKKGAGKTAKKLIKAHEAGSHEPVSLHPYIDPNRCIGSGACVEACPEKDVLGLLSGRGALVHGSRCVGHGACAAACPVGAITLVFGTEKRGVDIPHVTPEYETNIKGVYIVGELGGMGLIKNAVSQGRLAVEDIARKGARSAPDVLDIVVVGAGPAGIGASLAAKEKGLKCVTIEQDSIGGTVYHYPRHKIVMTSPVELPTYGKIKLKETTKEALLTLWDDVIKKSGIEIRTGEKMTGLTKADKVFRVETTKGSYLANSVILAVGRRGTPRKLNVPGEECSKVAYRLLEPEQHKGHAVLVVGGGDSAIEAALAISKEPGSVVHLSYRGEAFSRIKAGNAERLDKAVRDNRVSVIFKSNIKEITDKTVVIDDGTGLKTLKNDYVYILAGGELPNEFLKTIGIKVEKMFGGPAAG